MFVRRLFSAKLVLRGTNEVELFQAFTGLSYNFSDRDFSRRNWSYFDWLRCLLLFISPISNFALFPVLSRSSKKEVLLSRWRIPRDLLRPSYSPSPSFPLSFCFEAGNWPKKGVGVSLFLFLRPEIISELIPTWTFQIYIAFNPFLDQMCAFVMFAPFPFSGFAISSLGYRCHYLSRIWQAGKELPNSSAKEPSRSWNFIDSPVVVWTCITAYESQATL